jgi:hypothetical protein
MRRSIYPHPPSRDRQCHACGQTGYHASGHRLNVILGCEAKITRGAVRIIAQDKPLGSYHCIPAVC